jgi:2-hydroxy-3-keto-5-methylthiopentenyl-1-phosphate phosphatase
MLFIVDFDGTISRRDTIDTLLEKFADDRWQQYEQDWLAGKIDAVECMSRQLALVKADNIALESFFRSIELDDSFRKFHVFAKRFARIVIASDGLDHAIKVSMQHAAFPELPIFANHLQFDPNGITMTFPNRQPDCAGGNGNCKCAVATGQRAFPTEKIVLIGDGKSDACLSKRADVVFAKGSLVKHCVNNHIPFTPFSTFDDVLATIKTWPECHVHLSHQTA